MNGRIILFVVPFLVFFPVSVRAGVFSDNPPGSVGSQHDVQTAMRNAWLVRVKPDEKARFYENGYRSGCPALKSACREKAYLVPGDIAVAAYRVGIFTVIDFVGKNGDWTDGAVETRLLKDIPTPNPVTQDWVGKWKCTDEQLVSIDRTRAPSVLAFQGDATWGAGDPVRVKNGGVHTGSFAAYVKPVGTWGVF